AARPATSQKSLYGEVFAMRTGHSICAAIAASVFCFPVYAQTMTPPSSLPAAAAINGDPLPRGKPEDAGLSSERLGEIAKVLNADIERGRIPGAVIAIARTGRRVYVEAVGFRDKANNVPMTKDTIFNIASMTKPMAALAAL